MESQRSSRQRAQMLRILTFGFPKRIEELLEGLKSDDRATLCGAAQAAQETTCTRDPEKISLMLNSGLMPLLLLALDRHDCLQLQTDVCIALINIAASSHQNTMAVINSGAVLKLVSMYESGSRVCEYIEWALSVVALDGPEQRKYVISHGGLKALNQRRKNLVKSRPAAGQPQDFENDPVKIAISSGQDYLITYGGPLASFPGNLVDYFPLSRLDRKDSYCGQIERLPKNVTTFAEYIIKYKNTELAYCGPVENVRKNKIDQSELIISYGGPLNNFPGNLEDYAPTEPDMIQSCADSGIVALSRQERLPPSRGRAATGNTTAECDTWQSHRMLSDSAPAASALQLMSPVRSHRMLSDSAPAASALQLMSPVRPESPTGLCRRVFEALSTSQCQIN